MAISHLYPTQRPALDLNFARQKRLDSRVTFTRASTGTYVGSDGLIKTAASGEARFDHDSATGESLGLLVEESRTNYFTDSNSITGWSNPYGCTILSNTTLAPDGTVTADKLVETNGSLYNGISKTPSGISGHYTVSIYAKSAERGYVALRVQDTLANQTGITVNLSNGQTTLTVGNLQYLLSSNVQAYGNGWFRISCTYDSSQVNRPLFIWVSKDGTENGANRIPTYTGDGTSGIYIWGTQLEEGSFPTSYIPTSGSTVTRSADVASMTGTNFSSWFNQTEGSIFTVARIGDLSTANQTIASAEETASSVQFNSLGYRVGGGGSGYIGAWSYNSTGQAFFNINAGITSNTEFKAIHSYKTDDYAASVNGSVPVTDTTGTASTTIDRLRIGAGVYGSVVTGTISRLTYYPTRLSNDQLQALTL